MNAVIIMTGSAPKTLEGNLIALGIAAVILAVAIFIYQRTGNG